MRARYLFIFIILLPLICTNCTAPSSAIPTISVGESAQTISDNPDQTTITLAVNEYEIETYTDLIETFHSEHPDIQVVLVSLDDITQSQITPGDTSTNDSPTNELRKIASIADVFPSVYITPESLGTPIVRDLQPFLTSDVYNVKADYFPGLLERFNTPQGLYQMPYLVKVDILSYNQDIFDKSGIEYPPLDWSATDLLTTAERLVQNEDGIITRYGLYDNSGGANTLLYLADLANIDLLDINSRNLKQNESQITDLYQKFKDLTTRGVVLTNNQTGILNTTDSLVDPVNLISEGKIAMWTDSTLNDPSVSSTFNQGFTTLPPGSHLRLPLYTEGFAVSGGTQSPQQAWTFLAWLTNKSISTQLYSYEQSGMIVARQSLHSELSASIEDRNQARLPSYKAALYNLPKYSNATTDNESVFRLIVEGTTPLFERPAKTPSEAFTTVVQDYEQFVNSEPDAEPSPTADIRPIVVATPQSLTARPDQITIKFASLGSSSSEIYRTLRGFSDIHPEIFVQAISTDIMSTPPTIAEMSQMTDCFMWDSYIPYQNNDVSALADINQFIYENPKFPIDHFAPAILDFFTRDGRLIGIPYSYTTRGVVYNPDLFDKVGIKAPESSWTPEDFLKAARALTGNGVFGYSSINNYIGDIEFWVRQFGGTLISYDNGYVVTHFSDSNTITAIQWYLELATRHRVMPMPVFEYQVNRIPGTQDPSYELLYQGLIGMWFDSSLGDFFSDPNDPVAPQTPFIAQIAPLPNGNIGVQSADFSVPALYISANTREPNACLDLFTYINNTSLIANPLYGYIPADVELATSQLFTQNNTYSEPLSNALIPVLTQRRGVFNGDQVTNQTFETYWLLQALDAIVYSGADATTVLKQAESITNAYHKCAYDTNQTLTDSPQCAIKVDPKYQGYMINSLP